MTMATASAATQMRIIINMAAPLLDRSCVRSRICYGPPTCIGIGVVNPYGAHNSLVESSREPLPTAGEVDLTA